MTTRRYQPPYLTEKIQDTTLFQVQNDLMISHLGHINTIACKGICCSYGWNDTI